MLKTILLICMLGVGQIVNAQKAPQLNVVATTSERNWNGIAVSNDNRLFANFPRFDKASDNPSLVEIKDGKEIPFPQNEWNMWQPGKNPENAFVSLNALYINRDDNHLWVIDPGDPFFEGNIPGAPKVVEIDLATNKVINVFLMDNQMAPQGSHLNDIRIDGHWAFITDSGTGAILVLNRDTKKVRRLLANSQVTKADPNTQAYINGYRLQDKNGKAPVSNADQIELSPDKKTLYFMGSFGPNLYRVTVADLLNENLSENELAQKVSIDRKMKPVGGIVMDKKGNLDLSEIETGTIRCESPDKKTLWTIQDKRLVWPDAYSIAPDGTFYLVVAQISSMPKMRGGKDLRKPPYYIFSFKP